MKQLGEMLEVSDSHVSRLETGDKTPNVAMVLKIAQIFDVSTDVLIKDELKLEN